MVIGNKHVLGAALAAAAAMGSQMGGAELGPQGEGTEFVPYAGFDAEAFARSIGQRGYTLERPSCPRRTKKGRRKAKIAAHSRRVNRDK